MPDLRRSIELPHASADVYSIVADVESYPQFLPWLERVEIVARQATRVDAILHAARAGLHPHYRTWFDLQPTDAVRMQLIEGPMQRLDGQWRFAPAGDGGTLLSLDVDYEFANPLVGLLFGQTFRHAIEDLIGRVGDRAQQLHG